MEIIYKVLRFAYGKIFGSFTVPGLKYITDANEAENLISTFINSEEPCMIARFGSTELSTMVNYKGVKEKRKNLLGYVKGESIQWWWSKNIMQQMQDWSGFFPPTVEKIEQFCEMMIEDTKEVNILGSWLTNEWWFGDILNNANKISFTFLDPYWSDVPWTKSLKGKKVLVVHPFKETILSQYKKRELLFKNPDILPEFESLTVIKAVQSLGGDSHGFSDWFEALEYMKAEIDKVDYDVCLLGCGAYGFPLAAHIKRNGKKAVHYGGKLQLLFGIIGKRWENPNYNDKYNFSQFINEHWVRPGDNERAKNANSVEGACYW